MFGLKSYGKRRKMQIIPVYVRSFYSKTRFSFKYTVHYSLATSNNKLYTVCYMEKHGTWDILYDEAISLLIMAVDIKLKGTITLSGLKDTKYKAFIITACSASVCCLATILLNVVEECSTSFLTMLFLNRNEHTLILAQHCDFI